MGFQLVGVGTPTVSNSVELHINRDEKLKILDFF